MGAQLVPFLGIAYIGAAARINGHNVDIIDMCGEEIDRTEVIKGNYIAYGMPFSALGERIRYSRLIGVSCTFSQDWVFHRELIARVRLLFPESVIVAGGEHISAIPEYCLADCPALDICVVGEGENVFVQLLKALENKESLSGVPSLFYREGNSIKSTPRAARIADIDNLPLPAWDLTPMENYLKRSMNYHVKRGRTIPMLASRGCPHQCTFCSNAKMWSNPWIARNPSLVADEMEQHIGKYNANNFVFSDLTAVVDRNSITGLCREILRRKLDVTWQLPTLRTEALNRDVLKLMYEAGCRELDFAVESASEKVLSDVNKKNDPAKMAKLISEALALKINLSVNIVIGLPKETFKDFARTCALVFRLAIRGLNELNVFPFIPYPGSKLFYSLAAEGKIKLEDNYFYGLFGYADLGRAVSWSRHFTPHQLRFMRLFMLAGFYKIMLLTHPVRIAKIFRNLYGGASSTKLEGVLRRVFRNIRAYTTNRKIT